MRSGLLALRAVGALTVLVAAPVLGATAAQAHDSVRVTITPSAIAAGGEVAIRVEGCRSHSGVAASPVFVANAELSGRDDGRDSPLFGDTTIKSSARPGSYEINVSCDGHGHSGSGTVQVIHHSRPDHDGRPDHDERPGHHETPFAPVRAGGGGTATLAADKREAAEAAGPGTPHAVIGLVLAGVAAVAVAFRSVRRQRTAARDAD
ncbi:hypothetical protein [Streptomyces sp. NPDC051569]|uniref:hypothetical protein n=1 Tax=Streptomyces sp. NPDC051569 TaxID=3365661 RepID=UPI0037A63D60